MLRVTAGKAGATGATAVSVTSGKRAVQVDEMPEVQVPEGKVQYLSYLNNGYFHCMNCKICPMYVMKGSW